MNFLIVFLVLRKCLGKFTARRENNKVASGTKNLESLSLSVGGGGGL